MKFLKVKTGYLLIPMVYCVSTNIFRSTTDIKHISMPHVAV